MILEKNTMPVRKKEKKIQFTYVFWLTKNLQGMWIQFPKDKFSKYWLSYFQGAVIHEDFKSKSII